MSAVDEIKKKIAAKEYDPKDLPLFMKAISEIAASSEEIKEELESMEDTIINFTVPGVVSGWLKISGGKLEGGEGNLENADLTIEMTEEVARGIVTREIDVASAYMSGDNKAGGRYVTGNEAPPHI
jgi:putative sterol carrier protein